jgi:hypothetical protein
MKHVLYSVVAISEISAANVIGLVQAFHSVFSFVYIFFGF